MGYRLAIVNTLEKVTGTRPADNHLLFKLSFTVWGRKAPPWLHHAQLKLYVGASCSSFCTLWTSDSGLWAVGSDFQNCVALQSAPFEPLAQGHWPWALTFKTVFLVNLASPTRRTKLHTFSYGIQHPEDWCSITVSANSLIVAKIEKASHPDTRIQEVTLKALTHSLALTSAPTPKTMWSGLLRSTYHAPRISAVARNALSSPISRATTTKLRHVWSLRGWLRQFVTSMNIRRTRLHVSSMSRAMIFVLSPLAGMPYRKSPPATSCALRSGDLTTPPWRFTLLTSSSLRRKCTRSGRWSLLLKSLILELCSLQTIAVSTLDHTSNHFYWVFRSGYCCSLIGSVLSFLFPD